MKQKLKLCLIILVSVILTIVIIFFVKEDFFNIVSIGDSMSKNCISTGIESVSFNDYLEEYFFKRHKLKNYNYEFSQEGLTISELNEILDKNKIGRQSNIRFKQVLNKANLVIINIGMDELENLVFKEKFNNQNINLYLYNFSLFLKKIRMFYHKDIILIGLYPTRELNYDVIYNINNYLRKIVGEIDGRFVDITAISLNSSYYASGKDYHFNNLGHEEIFNLIVKNL